MNKTKDSLEQSRWQTLYGPASRSNASLFNGSFPICSFESFEDSTSVNEWLESLNVETCCSLEQKSVEICHSNEQEAEATKILGDIENMIREHDDDLMETILASEQHERAMSKFRFEKKARDCLRQWRLFTKNKNGRLQLFSTAIQEKRAHNIIVKHFQIWREISQASSIMIESFRLRHNRRWINAFFRSWQNEVKIHLNVSKMNQLYLMKRRVMRVWKSSIDNQQELQNAREHNRKYHLQKYMNRWKSQHFLAIEARINTENYYKYNKENEEIAHSRQVTELLHFLQSARNEKYVDYKDNYVSDSVLQQSQRNNIPQHKISNTQNKKKNGRILKNIGGPNEKRIKVKKLNQIGFKASKEFEDEKERISYLRRKSKEKMMKRRKEEAVALYKTAWMLSKLHYSLTLLRRVYSRWKAHIEERRLLLTKALKYRNEVSVQKYFHGLREYIKKKQYFEERLRFQNADKYHNLRLCESVLIRWSEQSHRSHHLQYESLVKLKVMFSRGRNLSEWKARFLLCRIQTIYNENAATKLAKRNKLSWIMRKFKLGIKEEIREREEDVMVARKFDQLKSWLGS